MENPIIFMFSGQGAQYYGMGIELFNRNQVFREWMTKLDSIIYEIMGCSIIQELYNLGKSKADIFNRMLYTHPAIFMVEYSLARTLQEYGIEPDYVLGASLGEFVSAAVAGVMAVEDFLECIVRQAQLAESYCQNGGMLAIIHDSDSYFRTPEIYQNCELAAINYESHFVVSGDNCGIKRVMEYLKSNDILFQELPVLYGFHSLVMDPVRDEYMELLKNRVLKTAQIPLVSCLNGAIVDKISHSYFWDVVRNPIRFIDAIKKVENTNEGCIYIDAGPAGTLANFAKYSLEKDSKSSAHTIITPFGREVEELDKVAQLYSGNKSKREATKLRAYVFPGQGSQYKGMGGTLFDEFREFTEKADKILGYSIKELCLNDPNDQLGQTQYTQPALFVVNALSYLKKVKDEGVIPDYVAGHSLGEYNALLAAGAINFETGLQLVKRRGRLMTEVTGGGMAAVIGLDEEKVSRVVKSNNISGVEIANLNSPSQIVISGIKSEISRLQSPFEKEGAMFIPLKVSGAFHSSLMAPLAGRYESFLRDVIFMDIKIPVISNYSARPYLQQDIKKNLINQITSPVKWTESIRYLMGLGAMEFKEVGPGNVLTGLIKKIQKEAGPLILSKEEIETVWDKANSGDACYDERKESVEKTPEKKTEIIQEIKQEIRPQHGISLGVTAHSLGNDEFKKDYNLKYAYLSGSMYRGIASKEMLVKMGKAGMMGFFGTGGLSLKEIEEAIDYVQKELTAEQTYGFNLLHNANNPWMEMKTVELYIGKGVKNIEASAYMSITPALVRYRAHGLSNKSDGSVVIKNRIIAKVSRPEVAEAFLSPAPQRIVSKLVEENVLTRKETELLKRIPMADDLCVEADSGGHTDMGVAYVLMPAMLRLRDEMMNKYTYSKRIRIGSAGGIGTPEAAAAAFILGADFILTGSINQCTVEANQSEVVKDMLQQINVQDTGYAPAGDMFEFGAKVQVLKKGVFFPARANKLYELYRQYNSLEEIDEKTRKELQDRYFKRSFEDIYKDVKSYYSFEEIERARNNPKFKMSLVFKWYFGYSTRLAMNGEPDNKVDYQVHCGPSLGAFNQWVKGSELDNWKKRHVDEIGLLLMNETAKLLNQRFQSLLT